MNPKLAAIQMSSGDDVAVNCRCAERLLAVAASQGAQFAVLPENFAGLSADPSQRVRMAERDGDGPVQAAMAAAARRHGLWLVAGTLPIVSDEPTRPFAACCVYDPDGTRVARYDKIHLFDVGVPNSAERYRESANTTAGAAAVAFDSPFGRIGIGVCYDLRFPELFRALGADGMDILALPAAFTRPTGEAHWQTLLQARAIENLCTVVAAAQTGEHPGGRTTWGHSMIIEPWGAVVAERAAGEGVAVAQHDAARQAALRERFPVHAHRRLAD